MKNTGTGYNGGKCKEFISLLCKSLWKVSDCFPNIPMLETSVS